MFGLFLSCFSCISTCSGARNDTGLELVEEDNGGYATDVSESSGQLSAAEKLARYEDAMDTANGEIAYLVFAGPFGGAVRVSDPFDNGGKEIVAVEYDAALGAKLVMDHGMQVVRLFDPVTENTTLVHATNAAWQIFIIGLPEGTVTRFSRVRMMAFSAVGDDLWVKEATVSCTTSGEGDSHGITDANCQPQP